MIAHIFKRMKLSTNLTLSYAALGFLIAITFSASLYLIISQKMRTDLDRRLLDLVTVTAAQVDGDAHATLQTPADMQTPAYEKIHTQLAAIHKIIPGVSYAYTMRPTPDGQVLFIVDDAEEDISDIGTPYDDPGPTLKSKIATLTEPVIESDPYTDKWGTWLSGYAPIRAGDGTITGVLGVDMAYSAILDEQKKIAWICLAIFAGILPFAWVFGLVMSRFIVRPLTRLTTTAQEIADCDLAALSSALNAVARGDLHQENLSMTSRIVEDDRRDAIGDLSRAFNRMIGHLQETEQEFLRMTGNLRALVGEVTENINRVNQASTQMNGIASENGSATGKITHSITQISGSFGEQEKIIRQTSSSMDQLRQAIEEVASGAHNQAKSISQTAQMSSQITTAITQIAASIETSAQTSLQTAAAAEAGAGSVGAVVAGMKTIKAKVDQSARQVRKMGEHSEQISQIVEAIEDIASQTNLLALNAAIEAARAGASGKGFAVVADEVRKLAEKSAASAKEIARLVKDIRQTVGEAVESMEAGAKEVDQGVVLVEQSGQSLNRILDSARTAKDETAHMAETARKAEVSVQALSGTMNSVAAVVESNRAATEQMAAASAQVTGAIQSIVSVSQDNSSAVHQVAGQAEQMKRHSEELSASASTLADMALVLQQAAAPFKA